MSNNHWVLTRSGNRIYFDGTPNRHRFEDIAKGLARITRYNGHTDKSYTVAQHSWLVCQYLPSDHPLDKLCALLHDAAEYVVGDMPGPLKTLCPDFRKIEESIQKEILWDLGFQYLSDSHALLSRLSTPFFLRKPLDVYIHETDVRASHDEMKAFFNYDLGLTSLGIHYENFSKPWGSEASAINFTDAFYSLCRLHKEGRKCPTANR